MPECLVEFDAMDMGDSREVSPLLPTNNTPFTIV